MLWRQPVEGASVFLAALQFPADCLPSRRFSLLGLSSVPSTKHHTPSFVNAGLKKKESVTSGRTRGEKKIMARFSFSIFPNSGGKIMECLPWILCCFGCDEERVSWRQKSVFCLIIAIFNHREICSSWRFCIIPFFLPPPICHVYQSWSFSNQAWTWRAWKRKQLWLRRQTRMVCCFSPFLLFTTEARRPEASKGAGHYSCADLGTQPHFRGSFPSGAESLGQATLQKSIQLVPFYPIDLPENHFLNRHRGI